MLTISLTINLNYTSPKRKNCPLPKYVRIAISQKRHFRSPKQKTKTLCNTKYPPKPKKTHLRTHFCPLESAFSAIATYETYDNSFGRLCPI